MFEKLREILNPSSKEEIFTALGAGESVRIGGSFLEQPPSSERTHNDANSTLATAGHTPPDSMPADTPNNAPSSMEIEVKAVAMANFLRW